MRRMPILALLLTLASSLAAHAADFYQGKSISFVINFTPGGPTDFEGRLLARHIGRHIPGAPTIVVRNMPGAGGAIGANWLGQVAAPDGLSLGYLAGITTKVTMGDPAIQIDMRKLTFIAGIPGVSVTYVRRDLAPGMTTPADIMKASDFWAAGLTPESAKDVRMRMQLDLLGVKYRYVSGYPGAAETRLALQRKEIHLTAETIPTYRASIEPALVASGEVIPLWLDPLDDGEKLFRSSDADGIPAEQFHAFYLQVKGREPQGELWDAFRVINAVGGMFLRIVMMPPATPTEASIAIKAALGKLQDEPEYREEAMKGMKFVPRFLTDARAEKRLHEVLEPPARIRQYLRDYIEKGKQLSGKRD